MSEGGRIGVAGDPGFTTSAITPEIARRQLRMSLALVGVLGLAILMIAASSGFSAKMGTVAGAQPAVQQPHVTPARETLGPSAFSRL